MREISKRKFLAQTGTALSATALFTSQPFIRRAASAETLVGVEWGGPWLEGAKMVAARQSQFEIQWETHAGAAAAIMAKIKTAWPTPLYDFVAQFDPLYYAWLREGWPEPLNIEEMPNLQDIPSEISFATTRDRSSMSQSVRADASGDTGRTTHHSRSQNTKIYLTRA